MKTPLDLKNISQSHPNRPGNEHNKLFDIFQISPLQPVPRVTHLTALVCHGDGYVPLGKEQSEEAVRGGFLEEPRHLARL